MRKKYGIFGGTFDPPHLGHLILAAESFHQLELDRLLWVLTPDPPHKWGKYITPMEIRLKMVEAALADNPVFELSRVDIERPSPHYAVDTVCLLRAEYPDADMIYLMGGDSLHDLHNWHKPQAFVAACHNIGVMRRPGDQIDLSKIDVQSPGVAAKVRFIDAPLLEISSQQIRQRIRAGAPYRYYLHPAVYELIQKAGIYIST